MCEGMERTTSHDSSSSDVLNTSMDKEATQAVQVALNVRPLITQERIQGCKDCILVVPGEPQVCPRLSSSKFVTYKEMSLERILLVLALPKILMCKPFCDANSKLLCLYTILTRKLFARLSGANWQSFIYVRPCFW